MATATRPQIAVSVATPLGYLNDNSLGIEVVINRAKVALMNYVNELDPSEPLTISGVINAALAVPGIERVPRVLLNGDSLDLAPLVGGWMIDTANEVLLDMEVLVN